MTAGRAQSIVVEDLSKWFPRARRHNTLRDLFAAAARSVVERRQAERRGFWALRGVSLRVDPGDVLGVIGANGAGKSTFLKLLTGILEPTRGHVIISGRIGALIEVSAGFHSELTGRENVYLQGAVMGMSRRDIARQFDAIVDFAGVADFIDAPVKHYSSGMSARLGFAIAAHLEPDVLLIDEVLSVGDHAFQGRAAERIAAIVRQGVPAVIVSHQLERVLTLCNKAVLLAGGEIARDGTPSECVADYLDGRHLTSTTRFRSSPIRFGLGLAASSDHARPGEPVMIRVPCEVIDSEGVDHACVGVRVRRLPGEEPLFATNTGRAGLSLPGSGRFALEIELQMNVGAGHYQVQAVVWHVEDRMEWARGPSTIIRVPPSPTTIGPVHLRPRMRLLSACVTAST